MAEESARRVELRRSRAETRLRDAFIASVRDSLAALPVNALADRVDSFGTIEVVVDTVAAVTEDTLAAAWVDVYHDAGRDAVRFAADALNGVAKAVTADNAIAGVVAVYSGTNDDATAEAWANSARLVREITEAQRESIRLAVTDGISRGVGPAKTARQIRGAIGLTSTQLTHVYRYRDQLLSGDPGALQRALRDKRSDSVVSRAIRDGKGLSQGQVDSLVARYQNRYVKYRAEVIGRTEALRAVNSGTRQGYAQLVANGQLMPDEIKRRWVSARDGRVRDSHGRLNGQVKGFDEPFLGNEGAILYPGDPSAPAAETIQCRCTVVTRLDVKGKPRRATLKPKPKPKPAVATAASWLDALPKPKYATKPAEWHRQAWSRQPDDDLLQRAVSASVATLDGRIGRSSGSYYQATSARITMSTRYKPETNYGRSVFAHEFGHHMDYEAGAVQRRTWFGDRFPTTEMNRLWAQVQARSTPGANPVTSITVARRVLKRAGIDPDDTRRLFAEVLTPVSKRRDAWFAVDNIDDGIKLLATIVQNRDVRGLAAMLRRSINGTNAYDPAMWLDTIAALSLNEVGHGHSTAYWKRSADQRAKEVAANYVAIRNQGRAALALYRHFFPEFADAGEGMLRNLAGE
jgi:hypothetical protein